MLCFYDEKELMMAESLQKDLIKDFFDERKPGFDEGYNKGNIGGIEKGKKLAIIQQLFDIYVEDNILNNMNKKNELYI